MPELRYHMVSQRSVAASLHTMPMSHKFAVVGTSAIFVLAFVVQRYYLKMFGRAIRGVHTEDDTKVTMSLFGNFFQIARLALPGWHCREFAGSALFILLFAVKAVLRVWVSKANGEVLATMLHGARSERVYRFVHKILVRTAVGMGAGLTSGAIEGIRPWLIGCYRERLSRTFQRRFYEHLVYYQATVLDSRLESADTVIATYCGEFAEHFAELPYYFVLPGMECFTSTSALIQQAGTRPALTMGAVATASVLLLQKLSPPFGRIHSLLLSREDDYRRMLTNDLANVENIAMQGAGQYTRHRLDLSLAKLKRSLDHMALAKGNFETLEVSFTTFLTVVAHIVAFGSARSTRFRRPINEIYLEINLIEDLNASVKDFVVNFKELSHLTEFSTKMAQFDTILRSIAAGTFIHAAAVGSSGDDAEASVPLTYTSINLVEHAPDAAVYPLVSMDDVVLKSPAGEVLFAHMNLVMNSDEDWVIIGENGCGKTSLLRMLCDLWPPNTGRLSRDASVRFLLAPQHSYMAPQCTLYEQICFPNRIKVPTEKVQQCIHQAIELAGASTVVRVIGGYESRIMGFNLDDTDETYDWTSLSGGQKQRISMARVFYHVLTMDRSVETPVAILDEATSMMDETEQDVLNNLRHLNVRMISVTHRDVVIRHHTNVLKIKRGGEWETEKVRNPVQVGSRVEADDQTV